MFNLILFFAFTVLTSSCTLKKKDQALIQPPENECTAYGHGPYDLDEKRCRELAINQARTNCSLNGKNSQVDYFGFEWQSEKNKKTFSGNCQSHLDKDGNCIHQGCQ